MHILLVLLLSLPSAFAHFAPPNSETPTSNCGILFQGENARVGSLGTGVLIRDTEDRLHLAYGSYIFASHEVLLHQLARLYLIKEVLWMGEMRFEMDGVAPKIHEANETSGLYGKVLKLRGFTADGRVIPISNDYHNIPPELRSERFQGDHWDPLNERLAPELNGKKDDLRHDSREMLTVVVAMARSLKSSRRVTSTAILRQLIALSIAKVHLAAEVLEFSLVKKMVRTDQIESLQHAIRVLTDPNVDMEMVKTLDSDKIFWEIEALYAQAIHLFSLAP